MGLSSKPRKLSDGPGGLSAGPFDANLGTTLATGATGPVTVHLDERLPAGPWTARITLRSGLVERSAHATVTFPVAGAGPAVRATSDRPGWLGRRCRAPRPYWSYGRSRER